MTDREIYDGILVGDRRIMHYLYREYFPAIARHVQRHRGQRTDAFDVFQDSVVALWANVKTGKYELRGDTRISTYLQGISRNVWSNRQRKEAKMRVVTAEPPGKAAGPGEPPGPLPEAVEEMEVAFAQLGDKCRRLLRLFYYEKTPLAEIATLMGYTDKTAKNNKYRCMQQLRAKLIPRDD